ncbi:MAG: AAA family ATPase [Methylococcales bacterium]|nr:AAA family ATPase [Methylococcales bacterium]MDD5630668.1 AAA family ATPase [Methylococcales bacterium]
MQKDAISIEILGSSPSKLTQYRSQIASLINKEVRTLLFDNSIPGPLYKDKKPPGLLIFLLDDITIEALNQLTALPSAIRPALLVIAANNDKELMRLAMQAGARDFFTHPVDEQDLHKSLNQIIFDLRRGQTKQGILTTVINAKGGSGASFIACNLAHVSSVLSNSSVVLMDFDLQFGTQSLNLDIKPQHTIIDALNDVVQLDFDAIDGYMALHKSGLRLLSATPDQLILPNEVSVENIDQLLTLALSHYDRVFIDLPRHINHLSVTLLERSDQIVIVVQQTLAHIRDAKRLTRILKSEFNIAEKNILIVVNRYNANSSLGLNDIQTALEASVIYKLPNDYDSVAHSINLGIPVFDYARNSAITKAMISLAKSLNISIRDEFKEKGFFKRLFGSKDKL